MKVKFDFERFCKARKEKQISQMELAELSGTTDRYIRFMEKGKKRNPSAIILYRASQALELPVEEFMTSVAEDTDNENG